MPSSISDTDLHMIVRDLQFLSQYAQGPETIKAELYNWAISLAQADPCALALPQVKRTIAHLICIANANAAFRRSATPPFHRGPVGLDVEDRGGYFLARFLVTTLVRMLPLDAADRQELARHALAVDDCQRRGLERLLHLI